MLYLDWTVVLEQLIIIIIIIAMNRQIHVNKELFELLLSHPHV
jgi:hypothetical protein